jgi:hypothetical protein
MTQEQLNLKIRALAMLGKDSDLEFIFVFKNVKNKEAEEGEEGEEVVNILANISEYSPLEVAHTILQSTIQAYEKIGVRI